MFEGERAKVGSRQVVSLCVLKHANTKVMLNTKRSLCKTRESEGNEKEKKKKEKKKKVRKKEKMGIKKEFKNKLKINTST